MPCWDSVVSHGSHILLGGKKILNKQYIVCQMVMCAMKKS